MASTNITRKKLIEEVRVTLGDGFSAVDTLSNSNWMGQIGQRFAAKLREEYDYRLASYDFVVIFLTSTLENGHVEVLPIHRIVSARLQMVKLGLSKDCWEQEDERTSLITNLVARALLELATINNVVPDPIESIREALLKTREDTVIQWKSKVSCTAKYKIEPYFKIKGLGTYSTLLYVRLTDFEQDRTADYLVAEADLPEVRALGGRFFVKDKTLWVVPKRGEWTEGYRNRGFMVPIQVPLDTVFRSVRDQTTVQ